MRPIRGWKFLISAVLIAVSLLFTTSCISRSDYEALQTKLQNAESQVASLQGQITTLQSNLTSIQNTLKETQGKLDTTNSQLANIKKAYPPKNFPTFSALSDWASKHIQQPTYPGTNIKSSSPWDCYTAALKVQEQALEDGYIVNATILPNNPSALSSSPMAILEAITSDGTPCWWNPGDGEVNVWSPLQFPR